MTEIFLGDTALKFGSGEVSGDFVTRNGERFYRIGNFDRMSPFLVAVVSGNDHWMYVSSTGGLTCGRGNPDNALFPYYTDDKIHDARHTTGPLTHVLVTRGKRVHLWSPLGQTAPVYRTELNLYKNKTGNRMIFEEVNQDLDLVYSYEWSNSDRFGFVRTSTITNTSDSKVTLNILDGLRNLLPCGVNSSLQNEMSTLLDAYKQGEVVKEKAAAIFSLSSILTDRAEPSEALKATVAWSIGLDQPVVMVSEDQVAAFCHGAEVQPEPVSKGRRCAFLLQSRLDLEGGGSRDWHILADVDQGPSKVADLLAAYSAGIGPESIRQNVENGTEKLLRLAGAADGCQHSSDERGSARHFSNALFNIMRGGTFYRAYEFPREDFLVFVGAWNSALQTRFADVLDSSQSFINRDSVLQAASDDADMERLALEYLPLVFSRRHGDPSRPWNHFSIELRNPDGSDRLYYQGNWRDIFQNWEALSLSYPEYIESFVAKFVNASTADGYNPYRITRDGFDWEVLEPENPWSNIGYWGDHQVNYLLKLLELSSNYHPGSLQKYLVRKIFVHADVPYRIRPYQELVQDPRSSVDYDYSRADDIARRVRAMGRDGGLVTQADDSILHVTLLEKLLLAVLTRFSNFVPEGGIWMNTQRPEWNDANNALAGFGLSMVTLCYLRRFLLSLAELLEGNTAESYKFTAELAAFFTSVSAALESRSAWLDSKLGDTERKQIVDTLGAAGETYRAQIYAGFKGASASISSAELRAFLETGMAWLDHSIAASRRADGLFHSYNMMRFSDKLCGVDHLDEMLEGQVAVLSSGYLGAADALELLQALRASRMYRSDKGSYMLYPYKRLPPYREKNVIPRAQLEASRWIRKELSSGRTDFVEQDISGAAHFNGRFRNVAMLREALDRDGSINAEDRDALCETWESVFMHRRFTGRSGAMYKYEGLGCIYWHMVSKLLLAVTELVGEVTPGETDRNILEGLVACHHEIKEGLGLHQGPDEYGAFPIDPYSHTTGFSGVQQPGMTGQVKEDFIARFAELGVRVRNGEVEFEPRLLRTKEFLSVPGTWDYSVGGALQSEHLDTGTLAFCLCGVTVLYRIAPTAAIRVTGQNGELLTTEGAGLGERLSQALFSRNGQVQKIEVDLTPDCLL